MAVWVILLLCAEVFSVSKALDRRDNFDIEAFKELLNQVNEEHKWETQSPLGDNEMKCPGSKTIRIPKNWTCTPVLEGKIINGTVAKRDEYPWFVYIKKGKGSSRKKRCGGMVIDSRWILTAAHCFDEIPTSENKNQVTETLCKNTVHQYQVSVYNNSENIKIDRVRFHNLYDKNTYQGDIAFAHLEKTLTLNQYKTPEICLKKFGLSNQDNCTIMGYGSTDRFKPTKPSNVLNRRDIKLSECDDLNDDPAAANRNMLCSGPPYYAFNGDSGGPVICYDADSNRHYVAGIIKSYMSKKRINVFTGFQHTSRYLCAMLEFLNFTEMERFEGCPQPKKKKRKKHQKDILY